MLLRCVVEGRIGVDQAESFPGHAGDHNTRTQSDDTSPIEPVKLSMPQTSLRLNLATRRAASIELVLPFPDAQLKATFGHPMAPRALRLTASSRPDLQMLSQPQGRG